ncbi:MAG: hypothetical protein JNL73_00780 [Anaerolineales bacterium]|nr:hypothetical protein [Anaerolineales bacterium]
MFSRRLFAFVTTLIAVSVSAACSPLAAPTLATTPAEPLIAAPITAVPPTLVVGPTIVAPTVVASPTATDCPTAWSWAYGPGSTEFDTALTSALTDLGQTVRSVASSTFGENNLCNGSFHAMSLDVTVELAVADAGHEAAFSEVTALVMSRIEETLPVSGIPNIGRVEVRFVTPEATWRCAILGASTECQPAP